MADAHLLTYLIRSGMGPTDAEAFLDRLAGAAVDDPDALTAPANIAAVYTEAEVQALRDDVAALRATLSALLTSLRDTGLLAS